MKLSILICTTVDRRDLFVPLYAEFQRQIQGKLDSVEILAEEDNKEISVGAKRQKLLERAQGEYIVFFDSDDLPYGDYIDSILQSLRTRRDMVGFLIDMTTNGKNKLVCCHSLKYKQWAKNVDGYAYVRNVTHFNPVKRELALQAGFKDMRFGEDKDYSDRLTPLCQTEVFIPRALFHYRYSTAQPHHEKYGFTSIHHE